MVHARFDTLESYMPAAHGRISDVLVTIQSHISNFSIQCGIQRTYKGRALEGDKHFWKILNRGNKYIHSIHLVRCTLRRQTIARYKNTIHGTEDLMMQKVHLST